MPAPNNDSAQILLCRCIFAALMAAFAALLLSILLLHDKKTTLFLGWLTVFLLIPGLVAARFVDKKGAPQTIQAAPEEIPFELKKDPTGAIIIGVSALLMTAPAFLAMRQRGELAQLEAWAILSLCPLILVSLWWIVAFNKVVVQHNSLRYREFAWQSQKEILYKNIRSISAGESSPTSIVFHMDSDRRVELNLIVFKREFILRMLQILAREAPQAQWDVMSLRWRNGEL